MAKKRIVLNITSPKYIQNHTGATSYVLFDDNLKIFTYASGGQYQENAIDENGKAWSWGFNDKGQLGTNNIINYLSPVAVYGNHTFCKIAVAYNSSMAIDNNGKVWGWGFNAYGQLGVNSVVSYSTPVAILGANKTFCKVGAGRYQFFAIDKNGKGWSWGRNDSGQLGVNSVVCYSTPVAILGTTKTFCDIKSQIQTALGLDKNGKLWSWGYNAYGDIGDNTTAAKSTPVAVGGANKTYCNIMMSGNDGFHSTAIDKDGKLWSWGYNLYGQLGDNTVVSKRTPIAVLGTTKTFCKVDTRAYGQVALDKNGKIWTWGNGQYGQMGVNNENVDYCTPIAVCLSKYVTNLGTGVHSSIVFDLNGEAWSWGRNTVGQIGDNTSNNRSTPVAVCIH